MATSDRIPLRPLVPGLKARVAAAGRTPYGHADPVPVAPIGVLDWNDSESGPHLIDVGGWITAGFLLRARTGKIGRLVRRGVNRAGDAGDEWLTFAMHEARQAHDARKVVHGWIGAETRDSKR